MSKLDIKKFVESNLAPHYISSIDDKRILDFLVELQECRTLGDIRLFFCIAIDLKSSLKKFGSTDPVVNPLVAAIRESILNSYNYKNLTTKTFPDGVPPQIRFALSAKKPSDYNPCFQSTSINEYARVISFQSYLRYVVKTNLSPELGTKIPEDIDDTSLRRYLLAYLKADKYKTIDVTRLGRPNSWVFVADAKEINETNYQQENKASEIIDSLGFYIDNLSPSDHFICIEYDPLFSEPLYQPESLTADWGNVNGAGGLGNEFFLSHALGDEWGRTHSVSGTQQSMKERVHSSFDFNDMKYYKMSTSSVGTATKDLGKGNMAILIQEAITRFENA